MLFVLYPLYKIVVARCSSGCHKGLERRRMSLGTGSEFTLDMNERV